MFGADKAKPTDFTGGRTADEIVAAALDATRGMVSKRLGKPIKARARACLRAVVAARVVLNCITGGVASRAILRRVRALSALP